jgi:type I restriction enzyme S subunit
MKEIKLKTLIEEISMGPFGSDIKVDNFIDLGVPVLNGSNLTSHKLVEESFKYVSEEKASSLGKANARRGDVVITHRGTLGQVSYIPQNSKFDRYIISQSQFRVKFKKEIDPEYFSYLMTTNYGQGKLLSFKNHVGVPALAQATTNFKDLEIQIHEITEQQKITKVLSVLDEKIELNNRINAELEAMAKLVYEYWFVQFDFPISAEQAEKMGDPTLVGKTYKSSGGIMVWNEELKREIPEGWRSGTISDIASLTRGVTYNKDDIKDKGTAGTIPILRATNITGNQIDLNNMIYVSESLVDEEQILNPFDILITMSSGSIDHIGKNGFYLFKEKVAFGAFCAKMAADKDFEFYLYSYTQSDFFFTTIKNECLGTNINNLNGSMVKGFKLVIPDNSTLTKFNEIVKPLLEKLRINSIQNQQLSSLRDWLLPMLMNGQVTVAEAEERVEEELGMVAEKEREKYNSKQSEIN